MNGSKYFDSDVGKVDEMKVRNENGFNPKMMDETSNFILFNKIFYLVYRSFHCVFCSRVDRWILSPNSLSSWRH